MSSIASPTALRPEQLEAAAAFLQRGLFETGCPNTRDGRRTVQMCTRCLEEQYDLMICAGDVAPKDFPKKSLLIDCHDFWVDAMQVLTSLPTAAAEQRIWPDVRRAYNACPVGCGWDSAAAGLSDAYLFSHFVAALAMMLGICIRSTRRDITVVSSARFGTKGAWPTSIADILPGDSPRGALSNFLCCWSRHNKQAFDFLVTSLLTLRGISHIAAFAIMDARHAFIPAYAGRICALGLALQDLDVGSERVSSVRAELQTFLILGLTIMELQIITDTTLQELVAGYEGQLGAALDEASRGESKFTEPNKLIDHIRGVFLPDSPISQKIEQFREELDSGLHSDSDPYKRFYNFVVPLSRESRCWVRGCQRYGAGGPEDCKLMRCSQCRVTRYCSRECQSVHWKAAKRPHKAVCATLGRIQDAAPFTTGEIDGEAFSSACRGAGIGVKELLIPMYHFLWMSMVTEPSDADAMEVSRVMLHLPPQ